MFIGFEVQSKIPETVELNPKIVRTRKESFIREIIKRGRGGRRRRIEGRGGIGAIWNMQYRRIKGRESVRRQRGSYRTRRKGIGHEKSE